MTALSPAILLSVRDLTHYFSGKTPQVNAISFNVSDGEFVSIIGPNGSGKSTLLRLIINELQPASGEIVIQGKPLCAMKPIERARTVALLTQHDNADLRLTVREYVALGRIPWQADCPNAEHEKVITEAINDVGIAHLQQTALGTLSGGERQRAGFSRALAQQPALLLLDEPTNHLDPLARHQLLSLVRRKNITTIAVLHDLELIQPFSDQVLMMNAGHLVSHGTPAQVLDSSCFAQIFGMQSLHVIHPKTGKTLRIFEALPSEMNCNTNK
ncbi:ABC transporter ATP-binding protein [Buttiauxella sp. B2]|uniref:ABC transporter ATP-binding protein n=1 Tax=Buttiauxella sp. B2 TaxID=2587812 RepID=UPI001121F5FC|nr:ABC transporter ATP-binding protein [Buttiauxella sp. B2]TNV17906.1 ABC transporter ATP-binding protein [Buttiauxella sp. B2]